MSTTEKTIEQIYKTTDVLGICDGQGGWWYGMGYDVHDRYAASKKVYELASQATGIDIAKASFGVNGRLLEDPAIAQASIATNSLAIIRAYEESNPALDVITGLSMGLYTAVGYAAIKNAGDRYDKDEIDFETISLIYDRALIIASGKDGLNGAMVPAIGMEEDELTSELKGTGVKIGVHLDKKIFTLTGSKIAVLNTRKKLTEAGAKLLDHLPILAPAHHDLQADSVVPLKERLDRTNFQKPRIRVAANEPFYLETPFITKRHLLNQMVGPAKWSSVEQMLALQGVRQVAQFGPDRNRALARQMEKKYKSLGMKSIVFPAES